MRAILIAPDLADKGLLVQDLETKGDLQDIYNRLDCSLIDVIRLNETEVMYVDDEGLMNKNYFFQLGDYPHPIAGRGLILGSTPQGENTGTWFGADLIEQTIRVLTVQEAYEMAKKCDQAVQKQIEERGGDQSFHITISSADIMESAWYSDQITTE